MPSAITQWRAPCSSKITDAQQASFGAEHRGTLSALAGLAYWTGEAGDAAARDRLSVLIPVRERVSGAEHPDTLAMRANLALDWGGRGCGGGP